MDVRHDPTRLRAVVEHAGTLLIVVTADGTVTESSGAVARLLGHDPAWMRGRSLYQLVELTDHAELDRMFDPRALADGGGQIVVDVGMRHALGITVPFALTAVDRLDDPQVGGLVVTGHDISDRILLERRLQRANSLVAAAFRSGTDGVVAVDTSGRITAVNDRFGELWELESDGHETGDIVRVLASRRSLVRDADGVVQRLREVADDPMTVAHEVVELRDGRVYEVESSPYLHDGELAGRVWRTRDVTVTRQREEQLVQLALHDPLTGLPNRALFRDRVEQATARLGRKPGRLAVLFVDLDDFKRVNDDLGHAAGDELLVEVSARIERCLRAGDSVARLGGDEFAVLVDGYDPPDEVDAIARRIVTAVRAPVRVDGRDVYPTASVGVASSDDATGADELLRKADLAMYAAKRAGKDGVRTFAPEMQRVVHHRLDLEAQLRSGVAHQEFVVHFQPIVDLATRGVAGFEALVRWQHPDRGLLLPGEFISVAEDGRVIDDIAEQVLEAACTQLARWSAAPSDHPLVLAVNVSSGQLLDTGFPARIETIVDRTGADPRRVTLEVTERALMRDPDTVHRRLRRVRRSGIRVAVDDFGTGYSSLAHLQDVPIDALKIDRTFVAETPTRPGLNLAGAIVRIARTLGLDTIAEGVESEAQVAALRQLGCRFGQGYHLGPPMPAADAAALVAELAEI